MGQEQSRARINAYSFIIKHLQAGMPDQSWKWDEEVPSRRSKSLIAGVILMVLVLVVVAVVALISPSRGVAGNDLVLSKNSGQMYVMKDGRLHPVSGIAAARLVLGNAASPIMVTDKDISKVPQGVPLGIAQGLRALPEDAGRVGESGQTWAMCDYAEPTTDRFFKVRSTMLLGAVTESALDKLHPVSMLAVHDEDVWLLEQGHRREVRGMTRSDALRKGARVVSGALLNSLVEMPSTKPSTLPADTGETSLCAVWRVKPGEAEPRLSLRAGDLNKEWKQATDVAQQDNDGDRVDAFLLVGRRTVVGFAAPLVGGGAVQSALDESEEAAQRQADVWVVGDDGVRFGTQRETLDTLGLGSEAMPLPWAMISQLSTGPYLAKPGSSDNAAATG